MTSAYAPKEPESPWIQHNGKRYARVSSVLAPLTDFDAINPYVLDRKADIGTSAHQAIADDLAGLPPTPRHAALPYYLSWCAWQQEAQPVYELSEQRLFDDQLMITGQLDGLVSLPIDYVHKALVKAKLETRLQLNTNSQKLIEHVLIDYKTRTSENKITWPLQANLYAHLLICNGQPVQDFAIFLRLKKNGGLPILSFYEIGGQNMANSLAQVSKFYSK